MLRDCDTCIEIHKLNHNMLVRLTTVRRLPQTLGVRLFSSIRPEGSVAQSKEFSKKERAHEDQFIRQHEQEQLRKLKADIDKKKAELSSLEKELATKQDKN